MLKINNFTTPANTYIFGKLLNVKISCVLNTKKNGGKKKHSLSRTKIQPKLNQTQLRNNRYLLFQHLEVLLRIDNKYISNVTIVEFFFHSYIFHHDVNKSPHYNFLQHFMEENLTNINSNILSKICVQNKIIRIVINKVQIVLVFVINMDIHLLIG